MAHRAASSSITSKWTYDVFLSFHTKDTGLGFSGHLHQALHQRGIQVYDDCIRTGENIRPSLFRAIQESRIAIIVFSGNYANSTFCLRELEKILECFKEERRLIYPVFYHVDPSELRNPRESYADALAELEKRFKYELVEKWRLALSQAADLNGFHLKPKIDSEQECITRIVEEVATRINQEPLHVRNYPVGLVPRVNEVISYLDLWSTEEIKMIGIWGAGGIGKSTIARALYTSIADNFEGLCFLSDVRKRSKEPNGLLHLQEILLSKLVMPKDLDFGDYHEGIPIIQHRLSQKKILLILDDVDESNQLKALAGSCDWFGYGSRIIITTRDKQLLRSHGIESIYDVKGLKREESLKLLSWHAFKKENVDSNYVEVCNRAVDYSCGFPLVLEVIGSNLRDKGVDLWNSTLQQLKSTPNERVLDALKLSYDNHMHYQGFSQREICDPPIEALMEDEHDDSEKEEEEEEGHADTVIPHGTLSSSITYNGPYHVFLNYCVEDRFYFIDLLRLCLLEEELHVFVHTGLRDDDIISTLFKPLHESRIAIIIFSEKYAKSEICLQALLQILESFKEEGRLIIPVYCNVDPSEAWARLGERFKDKSDQVEKWRLALSQGYHSLTKTMDIREGVRAIVERVTTWMNEKEKEDEEEHDDNQKEGQEEEEHDDKKKKEGEEEEYDDQKNKKEGEEEEHDDKKRKKEEEEVHDDTIHVLLIYHHVEESKFRSRLRDSLHREGLSVLCHVPLISSFIPKGQITYKTSKTLHESRIAIVVVSKTYATSANCLNELVQILKCFKGEGRLIYPVFYDVDPSEALAQLEKNFNGKRDQVEEWRLALTQAAGLSDYHHFLPKTMNEDECFGAIVDRVTAWLNEKDKYWFWKKVKKIGHGAHGIVYEAQHRKTRVTCGAIKELDIDRSNAYEYMRQEMKFVSQLKKHPNIVEYYGHKEDARRISIYMEYIQTGSLEKYNFDQGGKFRGRLVQNFTAQILFGLVHLHSNRQVHRDLKPDHLLVNSKNIVKLAGFGLAEVVAESMGKHSVSGTLRYSAPEVVENHNYQSLHEALAADIWSLGCVIIKMFSGRPPHWFVFDLHPHIPEELCQEGKDFLKCCFEIEPAKRPSAEELLEHLFVKAEAKALLEEEHDENEKEKEEEGHDDRVMPRRTLSSSITYNGPYHVFLSYCVEDHFYFTDVLRLCLLEELPVFVRTGLRDDDITSTLFKAIHESRIAIIVFSEKYANSEICLQELVQIVESFKEEGQFIFPVYCNADPLEAWAQLEERFKDKRDQVEKWKRALSQDYLSLTKTMDIREGVRAIVERVTAWISKKKEEEEEERDDNVKEEEEEEEEEHDDKKKKEGEEEEYDDKKKKEGEEEEHDDKKNKEGKEEEDDGKVNKEGEEEEDDKKKKKKKEEGHDDTIHVFLSYREGMQSEFPNLLRDVEQSDFPRLLRNSLCQEGLGVQYIPTSNWIFQKKQMTCTLSKALQKSKIVIIVFSKSYADSKYRLNELVQILKCFNGEGQFMCPVIYDVDPSEALAQLEKKFKGKREWSLVQAAAAGLTDYHHLQSKTMNVSERIQAIVEQVTAWMNEQDKYWFWKKVREIGNGSHGIVYEARHRKTGAICGAVKEVYKPDADEYIRHEIEFLSQLEKHPNIVEYYGHKEEGGRISLYMEYIQPGSLKNILKRGELEEHIVQNYTAQILLGLFHLHSKRRIHRDLKPSNLLVDSTHSKNIIKLADFGLAKLVTKSAGKHSTLGTLIYMAPEVIRNQSYQRLNEAVASDIWSLGCVIIEMFSGHKLFWPILDPHPLISEELCEVGKNFLKRCFIGEPDKRPSAKELLEDMFVEEQVVELKKTDLYKD